jgi:tetratricopeptide (TPR) repeat protein
MDEIQAELRLEQGRALFDSGDSAGALAAYRHVIAVRPEWPAPYVAIAAMHLAKSEWAAALSALTAARDLGEDGALLWRDIGHAMAGAERWLAAVSAFTAAATRDPSMGEAWLKLGQLFRFLGYYADARDAYRRAHACGEAGALAGWIESLMDLGELEEAAAAIAPLDVAHPSTQWLRARRAFLAGDLRGAWESYEGRSYPDDPKLQKGVVLLDHPAPRWRGEDLAGRSIAMTAEQGSGDVIQFARYARALSERGADVILVLKESMRGLAPVLGSIEGLSRIEIAPEVSRTDYHVPLLSIPFHLGTDLASIRGAPYLRAARGAVPPPLRTKRGMSVGIVWAGDPGHVQNQHRSTMLEWMLELASVPGVRLFSLQVGPRSCDVLGNEALVTDLSRWIVDFGDTAAIASELDLVVSVDTAVAHLAGALGLPTWVALAYAPDWRWMLGREDSPWYPSMRLFRQTTPGDWRDVFARMRAELSVRSASHPRR